MSTENAAPAEGVTADTQPAAQPAQPAQPTFTPPAGIPEGIARRAAAAAEQSTQQPAPAKAEPKEGKPADLKGMIGDTLYQNEALSGSIALIERLVGTSVDIDRAFAKAVDEADPRFIDTHYLREVLGDEDAELLAREAGRMLKAAVGEGERIKADLLKLVPGGEATMNQAVEIFNTTADEATRNIIADLFDSGDEAKMRYAVEQVLAIARNSGSLVVHNQQPFGSPGAVKGISRDDYVKAIQKRGLTDAEYDQLKAQRKLGISQGL